MRQRLSDRQLRRFYRLLSVRMTDFDCGRLCAPGNDGVPYCCDGSRCVPVLFREEYEWHRRRYSFWRRMPVRTKQDRELVGRARAYNVFGSCPGPGGCRRPCRALVCRLFPFEPFVRDDGRVLGLVYQEERKQDCPLIGKPKGVYNPAYIRNAVRVWQEILDSVSSERDLYIGESRKRERRAARTGKRHRVLH